MCESTEQRICIKFCFKIRKTATEMYQLLQQAYGEDAIGRTQVFDWFCQFKEGRSKTKVMLLAFFDSEGIVHHEYPPDGQTNNKEFYLEVLRRLCESVHQKQLEKWQDGDWILHHNNAPAHTSHLVQQFLAKRGTAQLQQLPYSPDLALCEFFLFARLKKVLKGHQFEATEDIKRNSDEDTISHPERGVCKIFPTVAEM